MSVRFSLRLTLLVLALVVVVVAGALGLTFLFSQSVPSATIRQANSGVITSHCSILTASKSVFDVGEGGNVTLTCSNGSAIAVMSSGTFVPTFQMPEEYSHLIVVNFNSFPGAGGPCAIGGATPFLVLGSGTGIALSSGSYFYCVNYYVAPSSTAISIASFSISWNFP